MWRNRTLLWVVPILLVLVLLGIGIVWAALSVLPEREIVDVPSLPPDNSLAVWSGPLKFEDSSAAGQGNRFVGGAADGTTAYFVETTTPLLIAISDTGSASARPLAPPQGLGLEPLQVSDVLVLGPNTLLLSDMANGSLWRYSTRGNFLGSLLTQGQGGEAALDRPLGLALDNAGRIVVVDGGDHKVKVFEPDGRLVFESGEEGAAPGLFSFPRDVAVSSSGFIFVADSNNRRVQVLNARGEFVRAFRNTDSMEGLKLPRSLGFDSSGNLHVADTLGGQVEVYSEEGEYRGHYGSAGGGEGLVYPDGLALLPGRAFVGDRGLGQLVGFRLIPSL